MDGEESAVSMNEDEEMSPEQMKVVEQEVIQRQIEATEAQLQTLDLMEVGEDGEAVDMATAQALAVRCY